MSASGDHAQLLRELQGHYTAQDGWASEATQARAGKIANTSGEIFFLYYRLTGEMAAPARA
ncbi:MAG: hypothetical protein F4X66_16275 [Chloroflexi bacterium]|nr:hypothetical protein [Chloroflexota bacterium]MYE39068.1 hypothetical protein [Chloroflexota bacterium]